MDVSKNRGHPYGVFSGRFFCQVPMAHRRARDLLAAMTAFAGTDNFVEARFHLQFQDVRICCIES